MQKPKPICKYCKTQLDREAGLWVDAISGDDGGTYDWCDGDNTPDNQHKPEATS